MRVTAVLIASLLVAAAIAPTAAAQGYVPICHTLCLVLIVVIALVGQCVNGEVQQTLYGVGDGCAFTAPLDEGVACAVAFVEGLAGLGEPCPA